MSIENGFYLIFSSGPGVGKLVISPTAHPTLPPYHFIRGSLTKDQREIFKVTQVEGSYLYTIHSTTRPNAALHIQGELIVASEALGSATSFSIEPAGEGVHRIHVPAQDSVATILSLKDKLHVASADGTPSQLFTFQRLLSE
ncbi:hypothetical protein SERLA73DRAFT_156116 [Serpula lacrymans var. lacrymans S7.3]|uniref:Uncharacterized protein n=2 Tax=Serpula lacrymans var. lacrymans TaxID=341189 RepID=F8QD02_SERL3|nr:uncharacterized protein SERLADRAFT_443431 [Serpula lacrymans var. lacrymans S7.9]EGN94017.1 hypothetical protein SERLA73DRAFT_156116 [Serpula lacrymans var. lacrymans S7.3]EGO19372.1 hypothetical protein SERLADRAFT_443431 [Serpula lacrymans var. lacrymans S7.9]